MTRRPSALLLASWLALPGLALAQEESELTPQKVAAIRRDEEAALARVDEAHEKKQPSEMDREERRQVIQEQQAASAAVLEKHGVTAKEYARYTARMGPDGNAAVEAELKRLDAEAKAKEAKAKEAAAAPPQEVAIQQGINEKNPVQLDADPSAPPLIEKGLPTEEGTAEAAGPQDEEEKPRRPKKKRGRRDD
jgi:hypothetical protein